MNLIRREEWDPFRDIEAVETKLGRLFDMIRPFDGGREAISLTRWVPSCDVTETDREYRIRAELPDVKKDDVHVNFENGLLTIQGDRKEIKEEKGLQYHRREISAGHFMRSFTMPNDADDAKVDAAYHDGVLDVTIPKRSGKEAKSREIAVH